MAYLKSFTIRPGICGYRIFLENRQVARVSFNVVRSGGKLMIRNQTFRMAALGFPVLNRYELREGKVLVASMTLKILPLPAHPVKLSPPTPEDQREIERLFISAFSHSEGPAEGELIGGLVCDLLSTTAQEDFHCFVAREQGQIVGGIVFSRLWFESGIQAFILAPVAVAPECQGRGIGQQLIAFGLDALRQRGVELVITYGDPAFYAKVGFQPVLQAVIPAPLPLQPPHGWLAQSLSGDPIQPIQGRCTCVAALNRPEYW